MTEYGYLLSVEDAEVVGKMLGSITKEKDILAYCQSKGKKVLNFDKSLATTDTVKYWPIIGLLVGLVPTIFIAFGGSGGWLGFVGSFCYGSLGIPSALLGAYIGKRSKSNTWIGAFLGMIPGAGLSIIIVFILFCCL